jgi:voltage-gated potassium channel
VTRSREEAFERFSRTVDGPMMVLALAMLPLLIVPLVIDLARSTQRTLLAIDYLLWAAFAVEYVVKLC